MEKNISPSEDSTTKKSPSSSPEHLSSDHDSPTTTSANLPIESPQRRRIEGDIILKTPMEVLAELTAGDDEIDGGEGGSAQGGGSVAVPVAGGSMVVVEGDRVSEGQMRKRKSTQVKDPPSGKPTCPECKKEFTTWKAAFGHMRKHPERSHRGFFPPPTFRDDSTTTSTALPGAGGDNKAVASVVQKLVFDLNQSLVEGGAESSDDGEVAVAAPELEEKPVLGFDLNVSPPPEDDDDDAC